MAATLTDPLIGHVVDGRYEVLSRIARGGMATVYLANDRRLDREVALKVMHAHLAEATSGGDFQARFRREARAAARLTHPGLVGVLDQGVDNGTSYLAMEYVEGTNLRRRLTEGGPLSVGDALRTTESVLEALSVAHRAQLVHRDIKPENVLLATDGRVKVADFGLARAVTEVTSTTTGTVLGTVAYLAPELVAHGASDARTDVYAVGIVLYEMLTGAQPYTGTTPIQVAYQHVHSDIPAPSARVDWLPTEVDELVEALAARDPDERPADAAAALALVRRTRSALDAGLLDRRADAPPAPDLADADEPHDPDATTVLGVAGSGGSAPATRDGAPDDDGDGLRRTMALRVGAALEGEPGPAGAPVRPPSRRRRRALWLAVLLVLAVAGAGTAWWLLVGPGSMQPVPAGLVGAERATAEQVLEAEGLTADVTEDFSDDVPVGAVVSTDPPEGEPVRKGGTVGLVVSRGPLMRTVPDGLVGAPAADARAALEAAGFTVPDDVPAPSDEIAEGVVIAASADSGASLEYGSEVTLTVSQGPAPVVVPDVVGEERQRAIVILEDALGPVVEVVEDYSEEHAAGVVAAQSLEAGTDSHRMTPITITVSLGPPLVPVPNVYGMNVRTATTTLQDAGFVVDVQHPQGISPLNIVYSQLPEAGEGVTAPKGSTVVINVF